MLPGCDTIYVSLTAFIILFVLQGLLAYVGGGEALTQVQVGDVPILSYAGSISFMLWRSVYLVKQVATRNRVLVTFDWVRSPTLLECVF
jgi:NADH dehydrogenase FAD-containing subunit